MATKEHDLYRGDVTYDVWRRGGNPDQVDYDEIRDDFYDGLSPDESATRAIRRQRGRDDRPTEEEYYQDHYPDEE